MTTAVGTGSYVDPSRAKVTVGTMAEQWFAGKINLRATTRARYESALRVHVMPRWADIRLDQVEHGDIQRWLAGLASDGQSGASVRKAHGVFSSILDLAVKERRLASNPSNGDNLPALSERGRRYLTAEQVDQLAGHARVGRLPVLVLAYCGAAGVRTCGPPRPRR